MKYIGEQAREETYKIRNEAREFSFFMSRELKSKISTKLWVDVGEILVNEVSSKIAGDCYLELQ